MPEASDLDTGGQGPVSQGTTNSSDRHSFSVWTTTPAVPPP